jgi:hypothetical protein
VPVMQIHKKHKKGKEKKEKKETSKGSSPKCKLPISGCVEHRNISNRKIKFLGFFIKVEKNKLLI